MARRWSSVRRVADMRCGMRVTPTPHMRVTHRCAAAEGSAGEGGFFSTHNEGDRCLHTRSYTRSPRGSPCSAFRHVVAVAPWSRGSRGSLWCRGCYGPMVPWFPFMPAGLF